MLGWYLGEECAQQRDQLLQKDLSKDCEECTVPGQGAAVYRSRAQERCRNVVRKVTRDQRTQCLKGLGYNSQVGWEAIGGWGSDMTGVHFERTILDAK